MDTHHKVKKKNALDWCFIPIPTHKFLRSGTFPLAHVAVQSFNNRWPIVGSHGAGLRHRPRVFRDLTLEEKRSFLIVFHHSLKMWPLVTHPPGNVVSFTIFSQKIKNYYINSLT